VAQIVSRDQSRAAVTVAELLRRCAPAPELDHDDADPVPVRALLRREGHPTGALPRVRNQPQAAAEEPTAPSGRQQLVRRGALAAGALLAAGSAFVLTTALHATGEQPLASGTYPGEGSLDGVAADTPSTPLDSGTAAPASWMPVAFPTALGGATVGKLAAAAETATHAAAPAAASTSHASTAGTATRQTTAATSATHSSNSSVVGGVADTTKSLGDTVGSVGKNTPVAGVTSAVGSTVSDVGDTVSEVGSTVGDTLDSTTTPVLNGVASAATPVVAATTPIVSKATSTVTDAATSTTGAVTKTLTKTVGGLLG
jgi:hypothetical protein